MVHATGKHPGKPAPYRRPSVKSERVVGTVYGCTGPSTAQCVYDEQHAIVDLRCLCLVTHTCCG